MNASHQRCRPMLRTDVMLDARQTSKQIRGKQKERKTYVSATPLWTAGTKEERKNIRNIEHDLRRYGVVH